MREVCDSLLPWLCENSEIRADIWMTVLEIDSYFINGLIDSFYNLLKMSYGKEYADKWFNNDEEIEKFIRDCEREFAQE